MEMPPLVDLPNHLARLHVLANHATDPALRENYAVIEHVSPYLLVDYLLTPLVRTFGVYDLGRGFVIVSMVTIYAGVLAISIVHFKRLTIWPALALPILFNHSLF